MTNVDCADAEGCLGRRIYSGESAKQARRLRLRHNEFMPKAKKFPPAVSVDGLSMEAFDELITIARSAGENRPGTLKGGKERPDGSFYGWAYVTRELAAREERRVVKKPLPGNPYHEEIHLPGEVAHNREEMKHHASELADNSRWCEGC